jgi:hypothetical protein
MTPTRPMAAVLLTLAIFSLIGSSHIPALASCDAVDPLTVLPEDDTCAGWTRDGEATEARTIEELAGIIDGGAFLFWQFSFVAGAFQNYAGEIAGEQTSMTLAAFNQYSFENAQALYEHPESGMGDPVDGWTGSGQARVQIALGSVTFQFWESCFFVSILVTSGGDMALPDARCMAEAVVDLIQNPNAVEKRTWGNIRVAFH